MITCGQRTCRTYAGHSRIPLGRSAVSELTVVVVAPGDGGSIVFYRHSVILPRCDCSYICHPSRLDGAQPLRYCSVAQLAISIIAPSPNRPVTFQSDRVVVASRNRDDVR